YEGEGGQSIPTSAFGDRPEMQDPREFPSGHLAQYEENKIRMWTTYNFNLHRFGTLQTGVLYRYDSPLTFTYQATVTRTGVTANLDECAGVPNCKTSGARNPGYKSFSGTIVNAFGDRG